MMDFSTSILRNTSRSAGGKDDGALPPRDDPFHHGPTFVEPLGLEESGTLRSAMHDGAAIVSRTTDTADSLTMDIYSGQALRPGASGGSFKMRGMQQQKGVSCDSDDMHSADDWKPEEGKAECEESGMSFSGNEGNDATQLLTGEGTMKATLSRAPVPFCCLPGNPKHTFLVGMVLIMVLFLCVPIGCLMALETLQAHRERNAHAISLYVQSSQMSAETYELRDILHLFVYFGEFLPEEMIKLSFRRNHKDFVSSLEVESGSPLSDSIVAVEYYIVSLLTKFYHLTVDDFFSESASKLMESLLDYYEHDFPAFINDVLIHKDKGAQGNQRVDIRDNIVKKTYTSQGAAMMARAPNLMQEARLACMDLEPCWTGGGREVIEEIGVVVGKLATSASTVVNDIFLLIEDPRGNATNLQEMVYSVIERTQLCEDQLEDMQEWYHELCDLLKVLTDLEDTPIAPGDPVPVTPQSLALFVLAPEWQKDMRTAMARTLEVANAVSEYYEGKNLTDMWLNDGAHAELSADIGEEEILSCVHIFESYFGINISSSLELEVTPELEAENTEKFNAVATTAFIQELITLLDVEVAEAERNLQVCITSQIEHAPVRVARELLLALIFSLSLSALLYVAVLYVIRYRLASSPFPFHGLMLVLLTLFILQCIVSVMTYLMTMGQDGSKRALSTSFLNSTTKSLSILSGVSVSVSDALNLALLIEPNVTYAATKYEELSEAMDLVAMLSKENPWMSPLGDYFEAVRDLFGKITFATRQQLTPASSLRLTASMLQQLVSANLSNHGEDNMVFVDPDTIRYAGCRSGIGAAAANMLTSSYILASAISEQLSSGSVKIGTLKSTAMLRASFEGNCMAAIMESAVDPTKPNCYLPDICMSPPRFGLLRDVKSESGVYQLFDPDDMKAMGSVLKLWATCTNERLSEQFSLLWSRVSQVAIEDVEFVVLARRGIVWMSIAMCAAMQFVLMWVWHALFGSLLFFSFF